MPDRGTQAPQSGRMGDPPPTYWDDVEAALTFARGQVYSASTAAMVERALKAFDRLKEVVVGGREQN